MARTKYFVFRTVQTFVMLWLILTFLFFLFRMMPGDFTSRMVRGAADPETIEAVRENWGLNDPLYVQYFRYIFNFALLDVGTSVQYQIPVWEYTKMKIWNTFILVAPAITVSYVLGGIIGTYIGINTDTLKERATIVSVIFLGSFPSFFIAISLIVIFASWLGLFPTSGMFSPGVSGRYESWWRPYLTANFAHHYVLPFTAVLFRYLLIPSLIMRTSVIEIVDADFTNYHRLTGLPRLSVAKHIAKHSILPVITVYPISMTRAIGGLVLIETVFNWPGIGYALVQAVLARDYPTVQFVFFVVAAFVIVSNYAVDIIYGIIDPRISVED